MAESVDKNITPITEHDDVKATTTVNQKIADWEKKLHHALSYYQETLNKIDDNFAAYRGTRPIYGSDGKKAKKQTTSVRKVVFELIETQVDSSIPQPKVTSVRGNVDRAQAIEHYLKNELDRLPMEKINDEQARMTSVAGSSSITPTVSAGYVTTGTVGTVSVSGSSNYSLTTRAATSYTPSAST